jgi:hypothetical protein
MEIGGWNWKTRGYTRKAHAYYPKYLNAESLCGIEIRVGHLFFDPEDIYRDAVTPRCKNCLRRAESYGV